MKSAVLPQLCKGCQEYRLIPGGIQSKDVPQVNCAIVVQGPLTASYSFSRRVGTALRTLGRPEKWNSRSIFGIYPLTRNEGSGAYARMSTASDSLTPISSRAIPST